MSVTGQLETKLQERREAILRLERDAQSIERKIQYAKAEVSAFEEALRIVQGEERKSASSGPMPDRAISLRPGTKVAKVREVIREAGKPLHIDEIMERMGQPREHNARVSLVGSLSKYVKSGQIFKRTAPNTFALMGSPAKEMLDLVRAAETPQDSR